jgi:hypothetical protein
MPMPRILTQRLAQETGICVNGVAGLGVDEGVVEGKNDEFSVLTSLLTCLRHPLSTIWGKGVSRRYKNPDVFDYVP